MTFINSFTFLVSFLPGYSSSFEEASTPKGCTILIASLTLKESNPPDIITENFLPIF